MEEEWWDGVSWTKESLSVPPSPLDHTLNTPSQSQDSVFPSIKLLVSNTPPWVLWTHSQLWLFWTTPNKESQRQSLSTQLPRLLAEWSTESFLPKASKLSTLSAKKSKLKSSENKEPIILSTLQNLNSNKDSKKWPQRWTQRYVSMLLVVKWQEKWSELCLKIP